MDKVIIKPPNAASIKKIENLKKVIKLKTGFTKKQRGDLGEIFEEDWFSNELCEEIKNYIEGKGKHNSKGFTRFTKSNETQEATERQIETVENIIKTTKVPGSKRNMEIKKSKLNLIWIGLCCKR